MKKIISQYALYAAWIIAIAAMSGSLFFSEVLHLPPCVLCWYQRILMYPLVLFIPIGILKKNKDLPIYVLPFSVLGILIATYHYLLQRGIIPDSIAPCSEGVSCTTKLIEFFGFVTIPFLSLIAFVLITICMVLYRANAKK